MAQMEAGIIQGQSNSGLDSSKSSEQNYWKQLGVLFLGTSFLGNGTLGITKSLLSTYLKSLGFSSAAIGYVASARGAKALVDIIAGYISDRFGRKKSAYIGQFFLVISHIMYGLSAKLGGFITSGALHGVGAGFNAGAATFGAADLMKRSKGLGQGLLECMNYSAQAIFGFVALWLFYKYNAHLPFILLGLAPILGAMVIWKYMKEPRDISGKAPTKHVHPKDASAFFLKILTNPRMLAVYYSAFLTKFVDDGILKVFLPLYVFSNSHFTDPASKAAEAALITTISTTAFAITVAPAGWLSDMIGRKPCMVMGTFLLTVSVLAMPYAMTSWAVTLIAIAIATGNALIYPAAPAATADVVPEEYRATGMGAYKFTHDLGIFVGPLMVGLVKEFFGDSYASIGCAVVTFIGTLLLLFFFKETKKFRGFRKSVEAV